MQTVDVLGGEVGYRPRSLRGPRVETGHGRPVHRDGPQSPNLIAETERPDAGLPNRLESNRNARRFYAGEPIREAEASKPMFGFHGSGFAGRYRAVLARISPETGAGVF